VDGSNILRKLEVPNRLEAAAIAHPVAPPHGDSTAAGPTGRVPR